jgi:hypothetical protein
MAMNKQEAFLQDLVAQFLQPNINTSPREAKKEEAEFANDCKMWILQLKSFVLDALANYNIRNSQTFLDFLDELNKISVIV